MAAIDTIRISAALARQKARRTGSGRVQSTAQRVGRVLAGLSLAGRARDFDLPAIEELEHQFRRLRLERRARRGHDSLAEKKPGDTLRRLEERLRARRDAEWAAGAENRRLAAEAREEAAQAEALADLAALLKRPAAQSRHIRRARLAVAEGGRFAESRDLRRLRAMVLIETVAHFLTHRRAGRRWSRHHRSGESLYLLAPVIARIGCCSRRLRLSNHDLPCTAERDYNHSQGWRSFEDEVIFDGTETWKEALYMVAEAIR